jgi:hypothetical protein
MMILIKIKMTKMNNYLLKWIILMKRNLMKKTLKMNNFLNKKMNKMSRNLKNKLKRKQLKKIKLTNY